jgi:hypothetical protein
VVLQSTGRVRVRIYKYSTKLDTRTKLLHH